MTLARYLEQLAAREPVPGGGSAAALSAALGASLVAMSCQYSLSKGKSAMVEKRISSVLTRALHARDNFLALASRDAEAYLEVTRARKMDKLSYKKALRGCLAVMRDLKKQAMSLLRATPYLYKQGNPYLLSDVKAAEEFLRAAVKTADIMIEVNS